MKHLFVLALILSCFAFTVFSYAESTPILIGGENTHLSAEGVLTGDGSSALGGTGAAVLDTFIINYQPENVQDWEDNVFPDPEVYSLQINIPEGLPNYQSQGLHGSFWDSRGRDGNGVLPWVREGDDRYDDRYRPAGDPPRYGVVPASHPQWTLNYGDGDEEIVFVHTCMAGTVEDFTYDEETGNASALLVLFDYAYRGYGDRGEAGPGRIHFPDGAYQGFDSFRESSGTFSHRAFLFEYDGAENTGTITPNPGRVTLKDANNNVRGYFDTITPALEAAEDGESILVKPGTYYENLDFDGKDITLASYHYLTGDASYIQRTEIDGDSSGSVILFENGETQNALLTGFTIRNGSGSDRMDGIRGGGIYIESSSPTITWCNITRNNVLSTGSGIFCHASNAVFENCDITNNLSHHDGGGFYSRNESSVQFSDCNFEANNAVNGGAVYTVNICNTILTDCSLYSNQAGEDGGGIFSRSSSLILNNCDLQRNRANDNGGGVYIYGSNFGGAQSSINNCTFKFNIGSSGGGFFITHSADPIIRRTVIAFNTANFFWGGAIGCFDSEMTIEGSTIISNNAEESGGGLYCLASTATIINSILWNNLDREIFCHPVDERNILNISYSDIRGGQDGFELNNNTDVNWGEGNIDANPLFVNPRNNYHLTIDSPCINAADPDFPLDPDMTRADMGVFYFHLIGQYFDVPVDFPTIAAAIDSVPNGDTILVHPGIYYENINFSGKEITIGSLYLTTGDDAYIDSTIIDGGNNGSVVIFENNETDNALLCGLTIQNGSGVERGERIKGGGIYISVASPVIRNCIIRQNNTLHHGGGIFLTGSDAIITDCIISMNSAGQLSGGGICCTNNSTPQISNCQILRNAAPAGAGLHLFNNCSPVIENCTISHNAASASGGGIGSEESSPVIMETTFFANTAETGGGGVSISGVDFAGNMFELNFCHIDSNTASRGGGIMTANEAAVRIYRSLLENNSAEESGAAIFSMTASNPLILNSMIYNNSAGQNGGAVYCNASAQSIINSILWENSPDQVFFCPDGGISQALLVCNAIQNVEDGVISNDNGSVYWELLNFGDDPMFQDLEGGNLNLTENSLCVNNGVRHFQWEGEALVNYGEEDFNGIAPDIGIYESEYLSIGDQDAPMVGEFRLFPLYPNPFNSSLNISFQLPTLSHMKVVLFNSNGQEIGIITDREYKPGYHQLVWNAGTIASGVYLMRVFSGEMVVNRKIILMK